MSSRRQVDAKVSDETLATLYGSEIEHSVAAGAAVFQEGDPRQSGALSRPEFRRRLKDPALDLTRNEQNMVETVSGEDDRDLFWKVT